MSDRIKLHSTSGNMVGKRVQHVRFNNVGLCCISMLDPFNGAFSDFLDSGFCNIRSVLTVNVKRHFPRFVGSSFVMLLGFQPAFPFSLGIRHKKWGNQSYKILKINSLTVLLLSVKMFILLTSVCNRQKSRLQWLTLEWPQIVNWSHWHLLDIMDIKFRSRHYFLVVINFQDSNISHSEETYWHRIETSLPVSILSSSIKTSWTQQFHEWTFRSFRFTLQIGPEHQTLYSWCTYWRRKRETVVHVSNA